MKLLILLSSAFAFLSNLCLNSAEQNGLASFYYTGTKTANGEKFYYKGFTCAHRTLPFGTKLRVISTVAGRCVIVRVNDRGPFVKGRIIDLTSAAFEEICPLSVGLCRVRIQIIP